MISYEKIRKKEIDTCNICGRIDRMTWDHVPPKSAYNNIPVRANLFANGIPQNNSYVMEYQNGVRYRSVCAECNNAILGKYDVEYVEFVKKVSEKLNNVASVQDIIEVDVNVDHLCRAILGHFLSAKDFYDAECLVDKDLRDFVLKHTDLPNAKLYFWIYPYSTLLLMRDVVPIRLESKKFDAGMISLMLSYPVAFMLTYKEGNNLSLPNLVDYIDCDKLAIPINTAIDPVTGKYREMLWPVNIGNDIGQCGGILAGEAGAKDGRIGIRKLKI